jgi:protein-L-isoaspartate O-methyltransferase
MEYTGERVVPDDPASRDNLYVHLALHGKARVIIRQFLEEKKIIHPTLIDIGCGCGYGTALMAMETMHWAKGIDNCREAVEYAQRNYGNVTLAFDVADALAPQPAYDIVTCMEMFEHVEFPYLLAETLMEVAGQLLIVCTPSGEACPYDPQSVAERRGYHVKHYTKAELMDIFPHARVETYMEQYFVIWEKNHDTKQTNEKWDVRL